MKYLVLPATALYLSSSLIAVHAATERDLESHVHGGAKLNIALDGQQLFIELETPWMNLVGFEHQPSNEAQHSAVADALRQLEGAEQLFVFNGARCILAEAVIESSMAGDGEHEDEQSEEHVEHDEHEDESAEEHVEHEEHEEHTENEAHDEHEENSHSAVLANYVFDCTQMEELDTVTVGLFDVWTGIEDIDVQLIGPGGQTTVELSPGTASLDTSSVL